MTKQTETLIFIPGLLSDSFAWQSVADAFSSLMPVVIADVSADTSITGMAQNILKQKPGQLCLAGHSMGGRVALEMVRLEPHRITKLALADTGIHPRSEDEAEKRQILVDLTNKDGMAALIAQWLPPMVGEAHHGDTDLMKGLTEMVLRADPQQFERQVKALLERPDAQPVLSQIKCPTLLIVGRQDKWSPVAQHQSMLDHLGTAQLIIIEDAGHFAPVEQPAAVIQALKNWINDEPRSSASSAE